MKHTYKSFEQYLNETPSKELEEDLKEFDHWNNIGPTVEEYLNYVDNI